MCGRYTLRTPLQHVIEAVAPLTPPFDFAPRYNIAPTQEAPIVRLDSHDQRKLALARWGLIPSWASDPSIGNRMINARAETAADKPAYRTALGRRRCLIPADAFYEWQACDTGKKPMLIRMPNDALFCMAGLWERWKDRQTDTVVDSMTILTTSPNALMKPIHDRMPVVLKPEDYDRWLNRQTPIEDVKAMLAPYADGCLECYAVSKRVNSPKNDDASLSEPLPAA